MKRFASDVEVDGEIDVAAVNGRHIADLVTLHTPQNISSRLSWNGEVTLRSHLYASGLVGGVNVTEWIPRLLLPGIKQVGYEGNAARSDGEQGWEKQFL